VANPDHLARLKNGVVAWNQWRYDNQAALREARGRSMTEPEFSFAHIYDIDLSDADLGEMALVGANLCKTNLRRARLCGTRLSRADLCGSDLTRAEVTLAILSGANLCGSILDDALLSGAFLDDSNLSGAVLRRAILTHANLSGANFTNADLSGADLTGAALEGATLIETGLEGANLTTCSVYGASVWNVRLEQATQSNLVITPRGEAAIQVDNLEVAQFIYLLLNNAKVRDVIDTIGKKAVLILGRFTPERKTVLDAIRGAIRQYGYLPILFDFAGPSSRDTQETILTLAGLARFIIADITDPKSVPQELASIVPSLPSVPVQPLLQAGYEPWGMYDHIKRYPWVLPTFFYENQDALIAELALKVIAPAEAKADEQARKTK
jgi:uncharacterized protein YjbI with pentapeptide repeats